MSRCSSCAVWLALAIVASGGCAAPPGAGQSPLLTALMSPDSVVLDIVFVRFPLASGPLNDQLWHEVDELVVPVATRRQLQAQGFRAGVLSGYLPAGIAELVSAEAPAPAGLEQVLRDFEERPQVTTRHVQARAAKPVEIISSGSYPRMPWFEFDPQGRLRGRTLDEAECRFVLRAHPQPDGRVRLELLPQIQHGRVRPQLVNEGSLMRFEPGRQRLDLHHLAIAAELGPGEMLVVGCDPLESDSLGARFFTSLDRERWPNEQKLLFVRLSQTQADPAFGGDTRWADAEGALLDD